MIKVLQFIHGLNMGGAETLVKDYVLKLDKKKYDVTVLCYDRYNSPYESILQESGINVKYICDAIPTWGHKSLPARTISWVMRLILVRRYIRKLKPDVIHIHLALNACLKFCRPRKQTVIFYTQHFQVERWIDRYSKDVRAVIWLMKHYQMQIIALNEGMKLELQEIVGIKYADRVVVLNNGIEMEKFRNAKQRKNVREKLNISEYTFIVGHVGRFNQIKNHKFLIDVFSEISKKNENTLLLMIGQGDAETLDTVRKQAENLNLTKKIMILSDRSDVCDLMKAMDIMVFPSLSEGMPLTLIEAQASGLRCLVSDRVPHDITISNLIRYKSLNDSAEAWADTVLHWEKEHAVYIDADRWDMQTIIKDLEKMYDNAVQNCY